MLAVIFDLFCTNAPNCADTPEVASRRVTELMVGATVLGTLAVRSTVFVPTVAVPFFVMQRMVTVPLVAFGMLSASVSGIVHECDVLTPVAMLMYEPPAKAYARSCVKDALALGVLMVTAAPMSALEALRVGVVALGMVFNVPVPLPVLVPTDAPAKVMSNACEKE
jgi:hypothetical protein